MKQEHIYLEPNDILVGDLPRLKSEGYEMKIVNRGIIKLSRWI